MSELSILMLLQKECKGKKKLPVISSWWSVFFMAPESFGAVEEFTVFNVG